MIIQIIIVFLRFYFVIWTTHTRHNYSAILQTIIFLRKITYPYDLWNYFVMVLPNFIIIKSGYGHFKLRNHFSILLFWSFWIASFDFNYYFTRAIKYGRRGLIIRSSEINYTSSQSTFRRSLFTECQAAMSKKSRSVNKYVLFFAFE